jgi:hypothetical protein
VIDRMENPLNRIIHSTDQKWIGQGGEPRT